jgi:hypothetical protein
MPMVYKSWKKPEYQERTTDHGQAYQSRDEKFPDPNGKGNLVSRLVFSQIPLSNMIYLFNYTEYYLEHWLNK